MVIDPSIAAPDPLVTLSTFAGQCPSGSEGCFDANIDFGLLYEAKKGTRVSMPQETVMRRKSNDAEEVIYTVNFYIVARSMNLNPCV